MCPTYWINIQEDISHNDWTSILNWVYHNYTADTLKHVSNRYWPHALVHLCCIYGPFILDLSFHRVWTFTLEPIPTNTEAMLYSKHTRSTEPFL